VVVDIKGVVMQAVNSFNAKKQYWRDVDENTVLRGDKSPLDSLAFVGLMAAVDWELKQTTGKDVQIFKPEYFLGKADNPYKTLGSLIQHVECLTYEIDMSRFDNVSVSVGDSFLVGSKPKIIFTDLDGTLWDGISGEGEVKYITSVCKELRRLHDCGVLIVLVTKNYKDIVDNELKGIVPLRDMFVVEKYNAIDKAATIRDVCSDLNLGLDSAVFLDDDEHERDRVKTALPMVWVPENHMDIAKIDTGTVTEEDRNRTAMYKQEYERARSKPHSDSLDDYMAWLAGLDMVMTVRMNKTEEYSVRANELIDRSNQFNFGKDRPDFPYNTITFSLKDKFGDMGIIGAVNVWCGKAKNFCVSCRVLCRGVENTIVQWLRCNNFDVMPPINSGKNKAAMDFWNCEGYLSSTKYPIKVIEA
jgi:FkbH-like protein